MGLESRLKLCYGRSVGESRVDYSRVIMVLDRRKKASTKRPEVTGWKTNESTIGRAYLKHRANLEKNYAHRILSEATSYFKRRPNRTMSFRPSKCISTEVVEKEKPSALDTDPGRFELWTMILRQSGPQGHVLHLAGSIPTK